MSTNETQSPEVEDNNELLLWLFGAIGAGTMMLVGIGIILVLFCRTQSSAEEESFSYSSYSTTTADPATQGLPMQITQSELQQQQSMIQQQQDMVLQQQDMMLRQQEEFKSEMEPRSNRGWFRKRSDRDSDEEQSSRGYRHRRRDKDAQSSFSDEDSRHGYSANSRDGNPARSTREKYRKKILPLLSKIYFPEKVASIDNELVKFAGKEHELYEAIKWKAKCGNQKKIAEYKAKLLETLDIPSSEVDEVLKDWKDREDALMESLQWIESENILPGIEIAEIKSEYNARTENGNGSDTVSGFYSLEEVKGKITDIVRRDHAEWINGVDDMLLNFKGEEYALLSALQIKSEVKRKEKQENQAYWYHDQIRSLVHEKFPNMIGSIDEMLREFPGKEQELLSALKRKARQV